jgi:hypothetical protein
MNLDNFLLTLEEATNLANDLIQQQVYKSGVSISEPAYVLGAIAAIAAIVAVVVAIGLGVAIVLYVWCYTDVYGC